MLGINSLNMIEDTFVNLDFIENKKLILYINQRLILDRMRYFE